MSPHPNEYQMLSGGKARVAVKDIRAHLQEGEELCLSHVIHPDLVAVKKEVQQQRLQNIRKTCKKTGRGAKASKVSPAWRDMVLQVIDEDHHLDCNVVWDQLTQQLGLTPRALQGEGPLRLPEYFPSRFMEVFTIPQDDDREALRGEEGIRATEAIPANTVLGAYQGYLMTREAYIDLKWRFPKGYYTKEAWRYLLDMYCTEEVTQEVQRPGGEVTSLRLTLSALSYGNETCRVNDSIKDPYHPSAKEEVGPPNCMIARVLVLGWPYWFLVTTRDVAPGQEFLYSYGVGYWEIMWDHNFEKERSKLRILVDLTEPKEEPQEFTIGPVGVPHPEVAHLSHVLLVDESTYRVSGSRGQGGRGDQHPSGSSVATIWGHPVSKSKGPQGLRQDQVAQYRSPQADSCAYDFVQCGNGVEGQQGELRSELRRALWALNLSGASEEELLHMMQGCGMTRDGLQEQLGLWAAEVDNLHDAITNLKEERDSALKSQKAYRLELVQVQKELNKERANNKTLVHTLEDMREQTARLREDLAAKAEQQSHTQLLLMASRQALQGAQKREEDAHALQTEAEVRAEIFQEDCAQHLGEVAKARAHAQGLQLRLDEAHGRMADLEQEVEVGRAALEKLRTSCKGSFHDKEQFLPMCKMDLQAVKGKEVMSGEERPHKRPRWQEEGLSSVQSVEGHLRHQNVEAGAALLHEAVNHHNIKDIRLLLNSGVHVDVAGEWGRTALHVAAVDGDLATAKVLLDRGAQVNARDHDNRTPLHWASGGHAPLVKLLLDNGAALEARDRMKRTPLHAAALSGSFEVAQVLLSKEAQVNAMDDGDMTPLHLAASGNRNHLVKLLLDYGAYMYQVDKRGQLPVHVAAFEGGAGVLKVLLMHGLHVDAQDAAGMTALHYAALSQKNRQDVVTVLLKHGAQVNVQDAAGRTALHVAVEMKNTSMVGYLNRTARMDIRDKAQQTVIDLARKHHPCMLEVLRVGLGARQPA